jgi:hypothetical protein
MHVKTKLLPGENGTKGLLNNTGNNWSAYATAMTRPVPSATKQ